jgi:Ca2+-binding EF-hand superfamily protein
MRSHRRAIVFAVALVAVGAMAQAIEPPTPYDPKIAFVESDTNGDGQIDIAEFHARLVEVFYQSDRNKDGALSAEELSRQPLAEAFAVADRDADGRVVLAEFVRIRMQQFKAADGNDDAQLSLVEVVAVFEGKRP